MGHKVFVSYKYKDRDVAPLPGVTPYTWVRDYVDLIQDEILKNTGDIYKGEDNTEDLSDKSEEYIWAHLKNKIYDSSVTIVLISPNMNEPGKRQRSQWIPWEIYYSLRETTRSDRTSHNNAILAVVLPDASGNYDYYDEDKLFPILKSNIQNGYIYVVTWADFLEYPTTDISIALAHKGSVQPQKIVKSL